MSLPVESEAPNQPLSPLLHEAVPIRNENEDDNIRLCNSISALMELGDQISQDTHATTHSLIWRRTGEAVDGLKARVYEFEGLPDKLERYRSRNLRRWLDMKSAIIKAKRSENSVVVYFADQDTRPRWSVEFGGILQYPLPGAPNPTQETVQVKPKSDHQKEVIRLRQAEKGREKRKLARTRKIAVVGNTEDAALGANPENAMEEDEVLSTVLALVSKLGNNSAKWNQLSPELKSLIDEYLEPHEIELTSPEAMVAFLKCKEHELIYLKRLEKKLPSIIIRRHDELKQNLPTNRLVKSMERVQKETSEM
ncbi:hypothetical protein F4820DRAFT_421544 [Hypoxylon rubiginosum]|uniref:Uncharacterized protein n=1 Tax=Hypoxylon rubiginosum TaxID=110542 RepID=A0ACB9YZY1_9PEZI|nr:hypothetical protein F4820DRAFT_421544 [Hypoxylon rubiginosum]